MTTLSLLSSGAGIMAGADINTYVGIVIAILLLCIYMSLRKSTKPAETKTAAPVAAPVAAAPAKSLMDDSELVAVITASIHAYEAAKGNTGAGNLVVRSITKRRW